MRYRSLITRAALLLGLAALPLAALAQTFPAPPTPPGLPSPIPPPVPGPPIMPQPPNRPPNAPVHPPQPPVGFHDAGAPPGFPIRDAG